MHRTSEKRITLNEVKSIVSQCDTFDETLVKIMEIQQVPDVIYIGNANCLINEFWLDEERSKYITVNGGYDVTEEMSGGQKMITYYENEKDNEGYYHMKSSETLAEYYGNLDKIKDRKYEVKYREKRTILSLDPLFDENKSMKVYDELTDKQRELQRFTASSVGFKKLTDEQYYKLSNIIKDIEKDDKIYKLRMLDAIGEADINHRLSVNSAKRVISDINDLDSYDKKDGIIMITYEFEKNHYYPDIINMSGENEAYYRLDGDETKYIVVTGGKGIKYEEMKDGNLEVIELLF